MTDKERILTCIITRIIPGLLYSSMSEHDKYVKSYMFKKQDLQKGDLVFGNTTRVPNDFLVGFIDHIDTEKDCVVIREIGSQRLCNYYNESFTVINKDYLGYEILEGTKYKIYQKTIKAFNEFTKYNTRFKDISFEGNICTVQARESFKDDVLFEISFSYNSKTTIKSIGELLQEKETE